MQRRYRWKLAAAAGGICALFAYYAAIALRRIARGGFSDFHVFYSAARAMLLHQDPYLPARRSYIYPPLIAFLYMPLALLAEPKAATIVLCANIAFLLLAVFILVRECLLNFEPDRNVLKTCAIALFAILLIFDKVKDELQMLQTNGLMLLMLALALRWLDRRPILAGIALGFACNIKYLPLILLPWLLLRRRWQVALFFIIGAVAFALLPALQSGWDDNLAHLSVAFGGLGHLIGVDTGSAASADIWSIRAGVSLSITSAIARLTHRHHADPLMLPIVAGIAAGTFVVVAILYRRNRIPLLFWPAAQRQSAQPYRAMLALEFASLMAMALVFSPQTNPRHLVLLLPATSLIGVLLLAANPGAVRARTAAAALLLLLGLTFPWGGTLTRFAHDVHPWFTYSGQGWCILAMLLFLIGAALRYSTTLIQVQQPAAPQITTQPAFAKPFSIAWTSSKPTTCTLVLPTYNAEAFIDQTLLRLQRFVTDHPQWLVLFVCDGCSDNTVAKFRDHASSLSPGISIHSYQANHGKGYALRRALSLVRTPYAVYTDVDLAYDPDEALKVLQLLEDGAELAVANRVDPASRFLISPCDFASIYQRHRMSRAFNWWLRHMLPIEILDTQAGLKGLSLKAWSKLAPQISTDGFFFDVELLAWAGAMRMNVVQTPVSFRYIDPTTVKMVRHGWPMILQTLRLRRRLKKAASNETAAIGVAGAEP